MSKRLITLALLIIALLCGCSSQETIENSTGAVDRFTARAQIQKMIDSGELIPTPVPTATPDPSLAILQQMSLKEKVAQMFFVRCPSSGATDLVETMQPGGLLLFSQDFEGLSAEQVKSKLNGYQDAAKYGLLIGADEEGGTVVRISRNSQLADEPYWSPRKLYYAGDVELVCEVEADKCDLLSSLGVNVNFAPVCDIATDGFMYSRSLGLSAEDTASVIKEIVTVYEQKQVGCILKHFPGYGNAADTHSGIAYDNRSYETFQISDFLPFQSGMEAGADCILVAHNIVTCIDPDKPASLSEAWHKVLRNDLGFKGVIITDDLKMGAIQEYTDGSSAAVAAVLAGNDMLCCSNYSTQYTAVLEAVQNGTISEARIEESVRRILLWKFELGLI